jgi:hypothetical protein
VQIIFTSPEVFDQQLRSTESLLLEIANETLETGTVNI